MMMTRRPGLALFPALLLAGLPVVPVVAQTVVPMQGQAEGAGAPTGPSASGEAAAPERWDSKRALAAMERVREEIVLLTGLKETQEALLGWNIERVKTGAPPLRLAPALCREAALAAWCVRLPATFETAAGGGPSGPEEEGENDATAGRDEGS